MNRLMLALSFLWSIFTPMVVGATGYSSADYVRDGLVAMWDCSANVYGTTWSDTTGAYPFIFTKDVRVAADGGLLFEADASYYATLTSGDTTSTFYQGRNGTLEVAVKRASTPTDRSVCVFQSSPASGHELFFAGTNGVHACSVQNLTGNYFTSYPQTTDFTTFTAQYTNAVAACAVMANGVRQAFNDSKTDYFTRNESVTTDTKLGIRGTRAVNSAFDGTLYCIRVYSRRLTPTEIARNCAIDRARFASACERTVTETDYGTETELTENGAKFKVLTFTNTAADGFNWTVPENVTSIDLLVVGGGGSGASPSAGYYYYAAGGGGAGGLVYETGLEVTPGKTYAIHVGAGGAATAPSGTGGSHGNAGSDSSFGDFYVAKGGGGGKYGGTAAGVAGGSGGGSSGGNYAAGAATQPSQPCGGYGNASGSATGTYCAGSGGGAGCAGRGSTGGRIALGGDGMTVAITGDPLVYACGGNSGIAGWSTASSLVDPPNDMTSKIVKYAPVAGRDGYGDGGAASVGKSLPSAKGGDGVVIVRYEVLPDPPGSPVPDDYEVVDSVASSGRQYIDTGILPQDGVRAELSFEPTMLLGDSHLLGARDSSGGQVREVFAAIDEAGRWNAASGCEFGHGGSTLANLREKYAVSVAFDGERGSRSLYLLASNRDGAPACLSSGKLFAAKFYTNETVLVRDYVPCRRKSDGAYGLFDRMERTFSLSGGGLPFFVPTRVGVFGGKGVSGMGWCRVVNFSPSLEMKSLSAAMVRAGALDDLDLLVMPGGNAEPIYKDLGDEGVLRIKEFLRTGGKYYGTCAGCALLLHDKWRTVMRIIPYARVDYHAGASSLVDIRLNEVGERMLGIRAGDYPLIYAEGPFVDDAPADAELDPDAHDFQVLATYVNTDYIGTHEKVRMVGRYSMLAGGYGDGKIFVTSSHPEARTDSYFFVEKGFGWLFGQNYTLRPAFKSTGDYKVCCLSSYDEVWSAGRFAQCVDNDSRLHLETLSASGFAGAYGQYQAIFIPKGQESAMSGSFQTALAKFQQAGGVVIYEAYGTEESRWAILERDVADTRTDRAVPLDANNAADFVGDRAVSGLDLCVGLGSAGCRTSFINGTIAFEPNAAGAGGDWIYGSKGGVHRIALSNALVSAVYCNDRQNSVRPSAVTMEFDFTPGELNVSGDTAMLTFAESCTIPSGSTLTVDARGKGPGVYKLLEARSLSVEAPAFVRAATVRAASGLRAWLVKEGQTIYLSVASDGADGGYTTDDYVQDGLVANWDCSRGVTADGWAGVSGEPAFALSGNVWLGLDGGVAFGGATTDCGSLNAADTAATFGLCTNGTLEIVYRRKSTTDSMFLLQSSVDSGIAAVVSYGGRGFYGYGKPTTANYDYGVATTNLCTLSAAYDRGMPFGPVWLDGRRSFMSSLSVPGYWGNSGEASTATTLGGRNARSGNHFSGTVYAIRLYARRLTAAEIDRNRLIDEYRFSGKTVTRPVRAERATAFGSESDLTVGDDAYRVLSYRVASSEEFVWTVPAGVSSIDLLAVGGGGSGGSPSTGYPKVCAGGGGAGGMVLVNDLAVTAGEVWSIRIGTGGAARPGASVGMDGADSIISNQSTHACFVAMGGGGGCFGGGSGAGRSGGSGGGGTGTGNGGAALQPASPSGGFGFAGAKPSSSAYGAGGGGAGSAGRTATGTLAEGGNGRVADITGESLEYARGGRGGVALDYVSNGGDGRDGFGDGGSAGSGAAPTSGKGGDGIVVVRYRLSKPERVSFDISWDANYKSVGYSLSGAETVQCPVVLGTPGSVSVSDVDPSAILSLVGEPSDWHIAVGLGERGPVIGGAVYSVTAAEATDAEIVAAETVAEAADRIGMSADVVEMFMPDGASENEKKAKLAKLVDWAKRCGKTPAQIALFDFSRQTVAEKAYLLNVDESDVEAAEKAFRFTSFVPGAVPTPSGAENANGTVAIEGRNDLGSGDWQPAESTHRFYRAKLTK